MRVLFINPPNSPFTQSSILIEPIDILSLASYVQSLGCFVDVLDMDAEKLGVEVEDVELKKMGIVVLLVLSAQ